MINVEGNPDWHDLTIDKVAAGVALCRKLAAKLYRMTRRIATRTIATAQAASATKSVRALNIHSLIRKCSQHHCGCLAVRHGRLVLTAWSCAALYGSPHRPLRPTGHCSWKLLLTVFTPTKVKTLSGRASMRAKMQHSKRSDAKRKAAGSVHACCPSLATKKGSNYDRAILKRGLPASPAAN